MEFCVAGGLQEVVLSFEFHQNRLSGFGAVESKLKNLPFPIDLAIGLYNSLRYRTSRDNRIMGWSPIQPVYVSLIQRPP